MDVCLHVITGLVTRMCMHVSRFAFAHVLHACLYVSRVCTMYASMWVGGYAHVHVCIYIYSYVYKHIRPNESTYIYVAQR